MRCFWTLMLLFPVICVAQKETDSTFKTVVFPGTTTEISLHKDFQSDGKNAAFINPGNGSSFTFVEVETDLKTFDAALTPEYWNEQNLTFVNKQEIREKGQKGYLYTVTFEVKKVKFERLIYVKDKGKKTWWVMANYPYFLRTVSTTHLTHTKSPYKIFCYKTPIIQPINSEKVICNAC